MKKSTDELLETLKKKNNIDDYLAENSTELCFDTLSDMINHFLNVKKLTKSEVIDKSNIERHYGYQIIDGTKNPSRDKLIMLCFGLGLNLDETQHVLKKCGHGELYVRNSRDVIIIFGIEHKYTIMETNSLLFDKKLKILE